jgi:hypothetical protein
MERRSFFKKILGGLAAAAVASELDPERLLFVPGAKTFFLPPVKKVEQAKLIAPPVATGPAWPQKDDVTGIDWATGKDQTVYMLGRRAGKNRKVAQYLDWQMRKLTVTKSGYRGEVLDDCDLVVVDGDREIKGPELAKLQHDARGWFLRNG